MQNKPVIITQSLINQQGGWGSKFGGREWLGFPELHGNADKVLASNPAIAAGWNELLSVMAAASVGLTGADKVPEIHRFLNDMLFCRLSRRFNAILVDILQALIYGVQPMQVIVDYDYSLRKWVLRDLCPIPPAYFNIEMAEKKPGEWWVNGQVFGDDGWQECGGPGSNKVLILWATFGQGLLGRSILRPIMGYNDEKDEARRLRGVGLSKSILGSLLAFERKPDTSTGETGMSQADREECAQALSKMTTGAANSSVGTLPFSIEKVVPLYPAADAVGKTVEAENHADLAILQAFGSQHLARGLLSGYGSQGASDNDRLAQNALRSYYYQWLANTLQPLLDWIVDLNFSSPGYYPELHIVSPSEQEPASLINSYVRLVSAGGITPTTADEEYFRQLLRLPEANSGQKKEFNKNEITAYYDKRTGLDTRESEDRAREYAEAKEVNNA